MTNRRKVVLGLALLAALVLFVTCTGVWIPGLDVLFYLITGWIPFLLRVIPTIHVEWGAVWSATLCAGILIAGAHLFLRWLHREMTGSAKAGRSGWRWRWTFNCFLLIILMFTSGMAAIGIVHQTAWLIASPRPLYHRRQLYASFPCRSNLRQIGYALLQYGQAHAGKLPDDFPQLLLNSDLTPQVFVCRETKDTPAPGSTPGETAENLKKPGHCSYIYLGKGLTLPLDPNRVLAVEPLENHENEGINVLRGDMSTEWLKEEDAHKLLNKLGIQHESAAD